jgi:hypothetical protein
MPDPQTLKIMLGTIATILSTYLAYRLGVRKQAPAEKAAAIAEDETAVQGWQKLAAEYRGQFEAFVRDLSALRAEVDTMRSKIVVLEQERDQHRFWRLIGVDYINACLVLLAQHGIPAPPTPPGLKLTE